MCAELPSVLWRCWLGGRKGIQPVKNSSGVVLAWLSVWSEMQTCIWPRWCHYHSLSLASVKSRLILPFWYPTHPGSPWKRAVKRVCVCSCAVFDASLQLFALAFMSHPSDLLCSCLCLDIADDTFKQRQAERLARQQIRDIPQDVSW